METASPHTGSNPDTIAELRDLYRSAEARAARLRLLIEASRELSSADPNDLPHIIAVNARRAALFAGFRDGKVSRGHEEQGLALIAPGAGARRVGTLTFVGEFDPRNASDQEDRDALNMLAQLIAAALDRSAREQERERLLTALKDRERHLEHLVERLFSAQEDERRYVSRELHDGVAQTATALYRRLDARRPVDEAVGSEDAKLAEIAKGLVRELRSVIAGLRPTALDDLGLVPAVETLADELRLEGYDVTFRTNTKEDWPQILTSAYFRIAQEAFANIRKHAGQPCKVDVALTRDSKREAWRLEVRDYGRGFQEQDLKSSAKGQHVGIEMMRERMIAVGGELEIRPANPGVAITATTDATV